MGFLPPAGPPARWTVQGGLSRADCVHCRMWGRATDGEGWGTRVPVSPRLSLPGQSVGSRLGPLGCEWGGEQGAFLLECSSPPPRGGVEFRAAGLVGLLGTGPPSLRTPSQADLSFMSRPLWEVCLRWGFLGTSLTRVGSSSEASKEQEGKGGRGQVSQKSSLCHPPRPRRLLPEAQAARQWDLTPWPC